MNFGKPSRTSLAGLFRREPIQRRLFAGCRHLSPFGLNLRSIASAAMHGMLVTCLSLGAVSLIAWAVWSYLDMPTVQKNSVTRQCVRVILADGSPGSCHNLPDRYEVVWVQ